MSQSGKFKEFFEDFDNNLETLGIRSYGISITTPILISLSRLVSSI